MNISVTIVITIIMIVIIILVPLLCKKENFENESPIYIITRTGKRKQCFFNLKKTIEKQTDKNFIHYKTNDDKKNNFLDKEKNVIFVDYVPKKGDNHCPYNTYLNKPLEKIDGWVLIIDDDAKFVNDSFLHQLKELCKETLQDTVILFKILYGKEKRTLPSTNKIQYSDIDMANICIHSSLLKKYPFNENCGADFALLDNLQKDGISILFDDTLPIGIWANYSGKMDGNNKECNL